MKNDHSRSSPSFGGMVDPDLPPGCIRLVSGPFETVHRVEVDQDTVLEPVRPAAPLRLVIIESPFAGDVARNVAYAKRAVHDALMRGEAPIASHLLFTQPGLLDDDVPGERALGIEAGLAWYARADACVCYIDHGFSSGMQTGIDRARSLGVPIEYRKIGAEPGAVVTPVPGVYSEEQLERRK